MIYLSLFGLFGTLSALLVSLFLIINGRAFRERLYIILAVVFFSFRAARDFFSITPGVRIPDLTLIIYHIIDASLLIPFALYFWLLRKRGLGNSLHWTYFLPYGYQFILLSGFFWSDHVSFEYMSDFFIHTSDLILIVCFSIVYLKVKRHCISLTQDERVLVYGFLFSFGLQVISTLILTLNFRLQLGMNWLVPHSTQLIVKSFFLFISAFWLYRLYGISKMSKTGGGTELRADPGVLEDFVNRKLHLDQDLKVESAARALGISKALLSKSISGSPQHNFTDFVNHYRLEHFFKLVEEQAYIRLSIMGMAESSGFKSKATFNRVFKAKMGITPSVYIRQSEGESTIRG